MPRVYMSQSNGQHVTARILERFPLPSDQARMVSVVKRLLSLNAPAIAVGEYMWHVNVGQIGRVILRGHSVRTVLTYKERFPGGTEYRISGSSLVRA